MKKVTAIVMIFLLMGTLFLIFTAGNTSAQSPDISNVRISNPSSSSVTVSWVASSPSLGRVDYGLSKAYGEVAYDNSSRMNGVVEVFYREKDLIVGFVSAVGIEVVVAIVTGVAGEN